MSNQREKIEALLSDGKWHSGAELNRICFRYSARIHEMRSDGIEIEKRFPKDKKGNPPYDYRMVIANEHQ